MFGGLLISLTHSLGAFSLNSFHEPSTMHTVLGVATLPAPQKKSRIQFTALGYYAHASRAKVGSVRDETASIFSNNGGPTTVELGDRLGRLNMLGLLLGDGPSPYTEEEKFENKRDITVLHKAYTDIAAEGTDAAPYISPTYSDPNDIYGRYSTRLKYERFGARGSLEYAFQSGLSVAVRSGLAQYTINPLYRVYGGATLDDGEWSTTILEATGVKKAINDALMTSAKRNSIADLLGRDFGKVVTTQPEDTSIEIVWSKSYVMQDAQGDDVVTVIPHVGMAFTLPTGHKANTKKVFDISLGNDGFYAASFEGSLNFDFPGMLRFGLGGSVTLFDDDSRKMYAPSSPYQAGIYPWSATVTKRPGALWKAHASVVAPHFIDFLNAYFSYEYVSHEKDSITITGSDAALFLPEKLAKDGEYSAQLIHLGFDYEVTPALKFGLAIQSVFNAKKCWKTTTMGGSFTFVF